MSDGGGPRALIPHVPRAFILKLVERCNIRCTYCYMYEFDKDVSRLLPWRMHDDIISSIILKLRQHITRYELDNVSIVLHGGEPLLFGKDRFRTLVERLREHLAPCTVTVTVQTNGTLLDEAWLDLFLENEVHFGISLDGPPEQNDRHRVGPKGRGTADAVQRAIRLALAHDCQMLFDGILAVVDPSADGRETITFFSSLGVPSVNFLMPEGNHATDPRFSREHVEGVSAFLRDAFDCWLESPDAFRVNLFEETILAFAGKRSLIDFYGNVSGDYVVIETDGGIMPDDVLRICGPENDRSRYNIRTDDLDVFVTSDLYPWLALSEQCQECEVVSLCGGGNPMHRYDGSTFANPSIYCEGIYLFLQHVALQLSQQLSQPTLKHLWRVAPVLGARPPRSAPRIGVSPGT